MKISELENKNVAIWGLGIEGQAMLDFLNEKFPNKYIAVIEDDKVPEGVEVIIRSPGVSVYKEDILEAKKLGIEFTSLINLFMAEVNGPKIIAVTGTKGKSTTSSIIAFMLEKLGYKVGLGGNIGKTPLDFLDKDLDFVVLELSSFQIADLNSMVDIGVVLNVSCAHLDWHLNLENYRKDKLKLIQHAKTSILNDSLKDFAQDGVVLYDNTNGFHVVNEEIFEKDKPIKLPELQIVGEHNLSNICAALEVLKTLGLDYKKGVSFLGEFEPLEHRLEKVYEKDGLIFVDDSIATVPDSVIAAVCAFKNSDVALIAGGYDNGSAEYDELNQFLEKAENVKVVLCLPDTGKKIKTSKSVAIKNMCDAVCEAVKRIDKGVVLLSPAAPSFNMYKNYKDRGDDFERIAREISE